MSELAVQWRLSQGVTLTLTSPRLFGILNVTPDSFSDGGAYPSPEDAVNAALRMLREGASMIDVGGESTRPGASRIAVIEQIGRVVPVIKAIRAQTDAPIAIDTTRREVAEAALDAGATVINDVSAGLEDESMFALAATRRCGLVLMHRLKPPDKDSYSDTYVAPPVYTDVVASVVSFLRERANAAIKAGVAREAIALDPGLGFGKTVEQNYELIARTHDLAELGYPVMCAASRKSFLGAVAGESAPARRVAGSVVVALMMHARGARLFRVHDVAAHRQGFSVMETIRKAGELIHENQGIA